MARRAKILKVDDEPDVLQVLNIYLEGAGYETCEASGGRDALAVAREEMPDLIILDILMPELDGYWVLRELKKDPRTAGIPVMVLTAKMGEGDRAMALELGATRYVSKPFTEEKLLKEVERTLGSGYRASEVS